MHCPSCRHENPARAKFCQECGNKLVSACVNCGTELAPSVKFCHECGTPAATAAARPEPLERSPRDYTPQHDHLHEAHRLFSEMGAKGHADRVARQLEGVGA